MTETASEIQDTLRSYIAGEIVCALASGAGERIECLTPLDYPSGDGIKVWIEPYLDHYRVTDYGESLTGVLMHPPQDHKALRDEIDSTCQSLGLRFGEGRLFAEATDDGLADAVWRLATAQSQIASMAVSFHPQRRGRRPESEFVVEIEGAFRARSVPVERERTIAGASGHKHKATIYLPDSEAIFEPIEGHWNQVASVYAKFGDLSRANGFQLFTLLDDRKATADEELAKMLVQVSSVVSWSRRDEWMGRFQSGN
jgi:hypothetical protein